MTTAVSQTRANARVLAGWPNALAAVFVLLMFVSLRILDDTNRLIGLGVAWIAYAGMIVGRLRGRFAADADGKRLALLVAGPADAFLLLGGALCEWYVFGEKVTDIALAAGVLCMFAGAAMVLALELAVAPMRATGFVDTRRAFSGARTALTLVVGIGALFGLCYGVEKLDIRRDFSFAAPTAPSQATISMLEAASCPAATATGDDGAHATAGKPEVFLFFERGSAGLGEIRDYFEVLEKHGARMTTIDSALDPNLAKAMKVSKNGTVGFRCGSRTDNWTVGDDRDDAQKKVGKMDEEVRTRLAKLTKDPSSVYVTVGHGERNLDDAAKGGERASGKGLKKLVEALNGKAKKLGIAEGLSKEVPKDADLVIVAGPTKPFLADESEALANYVKGGGSLLLLVDPPLPGANNDDATNQRDAVTSSLEPLLAALGVKVGVHEVLNDKSYVKNSNTDADHAFLFSTSFGNHKSVKTLSGARGKAALLFMTATNVEKRDAKDSQGSNGPKVSLIARTPAASWVDANDDRKPDEKTEARAILDLAAAVELPKVGDKEGRAIVVGDSDVLADMLIPQDANQVFGYETLVWLLRDDDKLAADGVKPDEDVPIRHTRDEDTAWFYLTILAGPVITIGGGLLFVGRKRKRRSHEPPPPSTTTTTTTGGAQ